MAGIWSSSVFFLPLLLTTVTFNSVHGVVPAIFILGDSTADVGTNNHFNDTNPIAKANFRYNGIDFVGGRATGRFSNGFNTADILSKLMGFCQSPSPFLDLIKERSGKHFIQGVNFASGGSGILNDTGSWLGTVVSLDKQILQFTTVRQLIEKDFGEDPTNSLLAQSIFFVSVGSNDIFENLLFHKIPDKQAFTTLVESTYETQLRILYSLGARKFGIVSVPPIGCCPAQRVHNTTGGCLEELNEYSRMFFSAIEAMLQKLSSEFKETKMKYSLGNTYDMVTDILDDPSKYQFKELEKACCGNGTLNGEEECSPSANVCWNRDEHLFWDWFHPTQAAAKLAAKALYSGETRFVSPINFKQLADDN